jgi:hypothetical protein
MIGQYGWRQSSWVCRVNLSGENMPKQQKPKDGIHVNIKGDVSGQVVVGNNNKVTKSVVRQTVTPEELGELRTLLADLRNKIQAEASPDKKDSALERVDELEQAVLEKKPDISTMEYVKKWFGKHLPGLAGTVVGVLVHPVVGKLVEAAGDAVADEFKKRFSDE